MSLTLYTAETRNVPVQVAGVDLTNGNAINPSSSTVTMGFVSSLDGGQTPPVTFYPAFWLANTVRQLYYATITVGPLGVTTLVVGTYVPWVKFVYGSETIITACTDTITVLV